MRNLLKRTLVFPIVLLLVFCMAMPALAAESGDTSSYIIKAVDADGKDVALTIKDVDKSAYPLLTEPIAAGEIGNGVTADQLKVVWQADVTAAKLPVTITYKVSGNKTEIYVFHYEDGWKLKAQGTGETITYTHETLSPVGLVVKKAAGSGTSPKTGEMDMMLYGAIAAVVLGGILAGYALRKRA